MLGARLRGGAIAAFLTAAACASPSPDQIRDTLVRHPEVVLDAIRAHPEQFVVLLDSVARATQSTRQSRMADEETRRVEAAFQHPLHPVLDHRIGFGSERARVTIVEYTDFECPYCREARPVLVDVMRQYGDDVRLVVKQMPMEFHPHAMPAALMFEAIVRQNPDIALRFYDEMYEHQDQLATQGAAFVDAAAQKVGADLSRAKRDAGSAAVRAVIDADREEARRFGFSGTPGFVVNGVPLEGVQPVEAFQRIIDRVLSGTGTR